MTSFGLVRVSTMHQVKDGLSLEQQTEAIISHCEKNGLGIPTILAEEGVSGFRETDKRPQLSKLLQLCREGKVSAVCVYDLSRLSRRANAALNALAVFRDRGIHFCSLKENIDSSSAFGQAIIGILCVFNEMRRNLDAERSQEVLDYKRSKQEKLGGAFPPLGYDVVEGEGGAQRLVHNKDEFEIIVVVNTLRAKGYSLQRIAARLAELGVKSKSGRARWHTETIRRLLRRTPDDEAKAGDTFPAERVKPKPPRPT